MTNRNTIDHVGFVDSVTGQLASVRINSQSACASCHAKGACSAADQEEKMLTVSTGGMEVHPGEQVKVLIARRTGMRAVAFGYVYPFLLLMLLLIVLTVIGVPELQAGLWSLASLLPYYLSIYLFRESLGNSFTFKLEKLFNGV
ncbi:MAG: SoxR reducing system RseC family protein [Bacteroidales bacterium]